MQQPKPVVSLRYKLHEKISKLKALVARPGTQHEGECARAKLIALESQLSVVDEVFTDTEACTVEEAIEGRSPYLPQEITFGPEDRDGLIAQAEERLPARARELLDGAGLTAKQRAVILLVYWQDMTETGAAIVLECTKQTVFDIKSAALGKIKRAVARGRQ